MEVIYLDCESEQEYLPDYKRRVKDKYFYDDPDFENKWCVDDDLPPYNIDDLILVRTTGAFPFNKEIHTPLYNHVYNFSDSIYFGDALLEILRESYPDSYNEVYEKCTIYSENKRDTLHFTLNGLVQSSMYGNFDNRNFIILEPFKYHVDDSLLSLRPEDTYFKGNMSLSDECAIIMSEEVYEKIKNDERYITELEGLKLFVYSGENQMLAVREALNKLGYDSFMVSNNYYTNGSDKDYPARAMTKFINEYADKNNISQDSHYYSDEHSDELELYISRLKEISYRHIMYILDNSGVSEESYKKVVGALDYYVNYNNAEFRQIIKEFIKEIGIDRYIYYTQEFNRMMIAENGKAKVR